MCKVLSEFSVGKKYKVLCVDEKPDVKQYSKYEIDGIRFDPVVVYDMPLGIAIKDTKDSFIGKEVNFV